MKNAMLLALSVMGMSLMSAESGTFKGGLWKTFTYDQPDALPIIVKGESRSENACAEDYCIYLDIWHPDGTNTWGVRTPWSQGTHGWEAILGAHVPKKPVSKIDMHVFLRRGSGKAEFRGLSLERREGKGDVTCESRRCWRPFADTDHVNWEALEGRKLVKHERNEAPTSFGLPPSTMPRKGFVAWVADSMRKVTPLTFPTVEEAAAPKVAAVELAQRERESFQVQISCGVDAEWKAGNVKLPVLKNERGEALKGEFKWERVGYVAREPGYYPHVHGVDEREAWLPDPLLPAAPYRVRKGATQGLWFTVHAAPDAKPGIYTGEVVLTDDGVAKSTIRVQARVRGFALPQTFGMPTAFCVMDGFTRSQYGNARYAEMRRQSWEIMLDHRLNPDDISRTSPPPIADLLHARERGMNRFNILNIVPPPKDPRAKWVCYAAPEEVFNSTFYGEFKARLAPYVAELRKHDLVKYAYLYGFDERREEYYEGIDKLWRQLKADFPDVPVMTTALLYYDQTRGKSKSPYLETTDWFCPLTPSYRPELSAELRKKGKQVWWYTCCGPHYPYANMASLEYPTIEGRLLGWMTHLYRSDGLLFWHVNYWHNNPCLDEEDTFLRAWHTYSGLHMPGDGIFLYPGKQHVLPSIRLAQVRDGVEDYEWLQLAAAKAGADRADAESRRLIKSMKEFTRDPAALRAARSRLGDLVEERLAVAQERDPPGRGGVPPPPTPVVLLPEKPTAVERSAATELAGELGKVLGEKVEIVVGCDGEGAVATNGRQVPHNGRNGAGAAAVAGRPPYLYVGATKAAKAARGDKPWQIDEVFLKSVDGGVVLDGDPARAPLYAVDLYLEKYCGVRWWTSTAAHYPHLDAAPVANIDLAYAPQFKYRETYYLDGFDPLFKVRSKGNFTSRTRYLLSKLEFVPKELGGDHTLYYFKGRGSAYHSFFEVLPPKKYFDAHPDWYSFVNGKRVAKQLCLANEEMKKEYIAETLKRLGEDPSVDFIQVSQNDWNGYCQCEKCKAMMAEDGGAPSGPYLRFANEVAEAVEKKFPNVRIDTFAYQFTRQAPAKTRPRHNVVVRLCDIECDFARPLDGGRAGARPSQEGTANGRDALPRVRAQDVNAKFVNDLEAWSKVAKGNLFIWDYLADFASYMMPHPNLYSIAPNIRLFAENGAVGIFEQGDALCSLGSFATLRHYVTSHLLWNPADDEKQLIDEFLVGYYGKSATPHLKRFLDLLDRGAKTKKMFIGCYHPGAPFWTVDEKLDAVDFMDAAEAAAKRDGAEYAERVRRERLSVDHYLLLNYDILRDSAAKAKRSWRRPATRAQAVEDWIRDVEAEGVRAVHETNDAKAQARYFEKLRGPEAKLARELKRKTAPIGDVRLGFAMGFQNNTRVAAEEMQSFNVVTNDGKVVAIWKGHPNCGDGFTVKAVCPLTKEGGFEWGDFNYSGNTNGQHVARIVFPEVYVPRNPKTALFVPKMAGAVLRPDWNRYQPRQDVFAQGPHFCVFRCMAALEEGSPSHFFDQRGEARLYANTMQIQNGPVPGTLVMRNNYLPPLTDELSRAGSLPFGGSCAPYIGGWWEAAMLHREWMKTQDWFQAAAKRDFSKFREIDLWMWGRGGIEVSEAPVLWFMKETGLKVALDWYWWHNVPYDTCYPFFWPPRDGEEAFRASVARMRKAGAFVQVYTNGMLWDCDDGRFKEGGMESTLIRSNGKIYSCVYNPFTKQAQALMCGEAPIFQEKMRKLEKTLASTGLDGVYMDMISCAGNGPCYNPRHHHAPGGGRAVVDGYRAYVQKVREDNPGFLLSSEATSEEYLDRFEAFIMLYSSWERNHLGLLPEVEPVPAVSVIFRGAAVLFGSFATPGGIPGWDPRWGPNQDPPDVEKLVAPYPDQFAVEFARGAVWGVQPMVHNFVMRDVVNPRVKGEIEFMKTTAKFWHDHRDFLFDGEMLAPVQLECATQRTDFLDTSSYQRPHKSRKVTQPALPTVFHSGWRAKDGREAEILVNWSHNPQSYRFERSGKVFQGTLPARTWLEVRLEK